MKTKNFLTIFTLIIAVFFTACKKDTFVETYEKCPIVVSTNPNDGEVNVFLNQAITIKFNKEMDSATITKESILISGSSAISGTLTYSNVTATFTPSSPIEYFTTYTGRVKTTVKDYSGNALQEDYVWTFRTGRDFGTIVSLGSAEDFALLSGVAISNNAGASEIHNLKIGVYPGSRTSITGFFDIDGGSGLIFNGAFYAADDAAPIPAMLLQAKDDLTAAYLELEGANSPAPITVAGDIGGQTLAPGIYKSTSTLLIQSGNLILDAQGDSNASWIFQIASDFTTVGGSPYPSPAGGNVILTGGAEAKNVFWQVGNSAVIGDYTSFHGNILALTSITMNAYSQTIGRMLCRNGSITLTSTNFISKP